MGELHIPVALEKLEKSTLSTAQSSSTSMGKRTRTMIGTSYFPEGTTANQVCEHIQQRQQTTSGLWLLQIKTGKDKSGGNLSISSDEDSYTDVKDSKHKLEDGQNYVALHYNGPDIFLMDSFNAAK